MPSFKGTGLWLLKECWAIFGGILLLCCYVASLGVFGADERLAHPQTSTPAFMVASIGMGCVWCIGIHLLWDASSRYETVYEGTRAYCNLTNLICSAVVFLLFCQVSFYSHTLHPNSL